MPVASVPAPVGPTTAWEENLWARGYRFVAGVDEVGRGAAVSAVVAAAVVLPIGFHGLADVRDSKVLTRQTRSRLAAAIQAEAEYVALGAASVQEIERLNVRGATALAMRRALQRARQWDHALIDGLPMPELPRQHTTAIVAGDARCLSIACASVVAKVARDRLLARLAAHYPQYGWEHNAGYLTARHRAALACYGPTRHHRRAFVAGSWLSPRAGLAAQASSVALPASTSYLEPPDSPSTLPTCYTGASKR